MDIDPNVMVTLPVWIVTGVVTGMATAIRVLWYRNAKLEDTMQRMYEEAVDRLHRETRVRRSHDDYVSTARKVPSEPDS